MTSVGFAGMTHLGLCSLAAAAERGFDVLGFDLEPERVAALSKGKLPVLEPGLPDLVRANRARIRWSANSSELAGCDVVYVAEDVPTDASGESDLSPIETLIASVDPQLRDEATLVILSQVPPGFTRRHLRADRSLYYQVETLVFGSAVERALRPERFILGCADPRAPLPAPWRRYLESFGCPLLPMRYESAELAKISINCCLVASISVANTLAELCESIGADWSEIVPALKLDRRIGAHAYLAPGLGIAGGNLERDLATVIRLAEQTGGDPGVVRSWLAHSRHRRDWVLRVLHDEVLARLERPTLAVLGLAYKQDTDSTRNSPSLALLRSLPGIPVRVYDPVVPPEAAGRAVTGASSALEACRDADALVIMTPWAEFASLDPRAVRARLRTPLVIDPYRVLEGPSCRAAGLDYLTLGEPPLRAARPQGAPPCSND